MDFKEMAHERYSVRKYSARPLEREKLDEILAAAMLAPTAKNQQPLRIYVLQSAEALPAALLTVVFFVPFAYYYSRVRVSGPGIGGAGSLKAGAGRGTHFTRRGL